MRMNRRQLVGAGLGALAMPAVSRLAHAQASTVRLGKQFGLPYLPQMVMEKLKLIEKHAAKDGLPALTAEWMQLAGPSALNDALLSGNIDIINVAAPSLATPPSRTAVATFNGPTSRTTATPTPRARQASPSPTHSSKLWPTTAARPRPWPSRAAALRSTPAAAAPNTTSAAWRARAPATRAPSNSSPDRRGGPICARGELFSRAPLRPVHVASPLLLRSSPPYSRPRTARDRR